MTTNRVEILYRLAEVEAPGFLRAVGHAADLAHNEREFQTVVTRFIDDFAKKAEVELVLREEYTLARGRADSVYNRLVIE
ncbi:MAG: hypothetical protein JXA58_01610, partial [Dehalococcoidia bacterium]|nr:hypothetical protein [Dehalococcoidia bacterium]